MRSLFVVPFIVLSLSSLFATRAEAKCASYAEWAVTTEVIGGRPLIVASVYSLFEDGGGAAQFELRDAKGRRFALRETERHVGWRTLQLGYVPVEALPPGTYVLHNTARKPDAWASAERLTVVVQGEEASGVRAPEAPALTVLRSELERFGCGPAENLHVAVGATSAKLARVTLRDAQNQAQTVWVPVGHDDKDGAVLALGHGMCSGELGLAVGMTYTIEVALVDARGLVGATASTTARYAP